MADTAVVINTKLDNKELAKQLKDLQRDIKKTEESISKMETQKSPLEKQAETLRAKIKEARAEAERYRQEWYGGRVGADRDQTAAKSKAAVLESELNGVLTKIGGIDDKLLPAYSRLEQMKTEAGGLQQRMAGAGRNSEAMALAQKKAAASAKLFSKRLAAVVRSALVFTLITQSLAKFRDWMGKVIKTNDEAKTAVAKLKGALLTMAQPLVDVIIPAFVALVNILTRVISTVAQLFSALSGTTVDASKKSAEALREETEALEGNSKAAKKASKSLAGFDEINKLSASSESSKDDGEIAPDFSFDANMNNSQLQNILGLVELIGAGFLAWKLSEVFKLDLEKTLWAALAIYSAIQFVKYAFDAWTNGVDMSNLLGMLGSAAVLAFALYKAFGTTAAGISLVVTGLTMLVTGFHDAMEVGWNFENTLLTIAGILATGLGISLIMTSWIPLLIAGIAAVLLALTVATGHGDELLEGLRLAFEGLVDFVAGIFTGDIERALGGVEKIFDGLEIAFFAIIAGIEDSFNSFLTWLDEKTGGKLSWIIDNVRKYFSDSIALVKNTLSGLLDAVKQVLGGIVKFISGVFTNDWDLAWDGVKDIFRGILNGIITIAESMVNAVINGINACIRSFNNLLSLGDGISEKIFGKTLRVNELKTVSLPRVPRLATGAVIPPNREFLAVLGDQKSGTNIEAPLATIKQAMLEALRESGGSGSETITVVVNLDGREVARNQVKHINDMTRQAGKPVLLF